MPTPRAIRKWRMVSSTILLIFLAIGALFFAVIFFIPLLLALIGIAAGVA